MHSKGACCVLVFCLVVFLFLVFKMEGSLELYASPNHGEGMDP